MNVRCPGHRSAYTRRVSPVSSRLAPFGSTVFSEISARARRLGAVDLGQGYPSFEGPSFVKEAAVAAIREQSNQYPPSVGIATLREAIARRRLLDTGLPVDAETEVTVTSGCTEALAATFLGLLEPGDEVILLEPAYDAYAAGCALAGARPRPVALPPPGFRISAEALASAVTPRTRALVLNNPHNPTGRVFDADELAAVADVCRRHDLVAVTDEVYERIVFGPPPPRLAALPGMAERTISLSSLGKTFSLTGWKVGWAVAPAPLTEAVRAAHQFLTFTTPNPLQHAAAVALDVGEEHYTELAGFYRRKRDLLAEGLDGIGFGVHLPEGTFYLLADHSAFGFASDVAFVDHLVAEIGVAAIPPSVFSSDGAGSHLVRFAFCKDDELLREALVRLGRLRPAGVTARG